MSALRRRFLLGALVLLGACAQRQESAEQEPLQVAPAEWLADVRSVHLRVDEALARGDGAAAAGALRASIAQPPPLDVALAHRRAVQHDLHYRLSTVEADRGDYAAALLAADAGLAIGRVPDVFTANLLIARGAALEQLGRDTEAAASYYDALEINRLLLADVLPAPDAGSPR